MLYIDILIASSKRRAAEEAAAAAAARPAKAETGGEQLAYLRTLSAVQSHDPRRPKPAPREKLIDFFARGPFAIDWPAPGGAWGVSAAEKAAVLGDGWIHYKNGDPHPDGVDCEVMFLDGDTENVKAEHTSYALWENSGNYLDVIAWRRATPAAGLANLIRDQRAKAEPVNQQLTTAITPEALRAAFERAGVTVVEWLNHAGKWDARFVTCPDNYAPAHAWTPNHNTPDRLRPGSGTSGATLKSFYSQWDVVEILDDASNWLRRDTERNYSFDAGRYRLPSDAQLVRPL